MAKRVRGSVRPGQRRPSQRGQRPSTAAPRPSATSAAAASARAASTAPAPANGLTPEEEARAAELEAAIVAQEQAAVAPTRAGRRDRDRDAATLTPNRLRPQSGASLAARYAHEYDYVSRDLREIFVLMVVLVGLLVAIWFLLVNVLGL